ncbi:winged helix-turn-helix transcriptional regulator [Escherichia coli]|nr:winged helix-turn-helix transcriptional regulator [Escherichia coli]KUW22641.1 hypothetical protein AWF60_14825 [Escherichia coli]
MIAITGATGQLGHYVIESLMKTVPASQIVAIVRNPAKAQALAAQGITVRQADYGDEAALTSALQGVEKLLLISSSEVGQRAPQHRNVINAAKAAGVKFIAYTSLLHADTSPLGLADEHIETEKMLADSGIVYTLLRKMGGVSEKMLAQSLQALEQDGFLNRIAYPVVPPHVEYSLTPLGEQVSEKVAALADWIELNLPEVLAVRDERAA